MDSDYQKIVVSSTCNGTISPSEFCKSALDFAEKWKIFNSCLPKWSWIPSPRKQSFIKSHQVEGYLSLTNAVLQRSTEDDDDDDDGCRITEPIELISSDTDERVDDAILVQRCGNDVHYDFHVLYSSSYRVPVLYFRAYYKDGQPLVLDEIEKDLPASSGKILSEAKWTFITQEEHPYLNMPWYTLHPCGTSEWMNLLLHTQKTDRGDGVDDSAGSSTTMDVRAADQYLVSWFSVVGQVFGLKIPFQTVHNYTS